MARYPTCTGACSRVRVHTCMTWVCSWPIYPRALVFCFIINLYECFG